MAVVNTSVGYIPITLVAEILARFVTGYRDNQWTSGRGATPPSDATRFTVYAPPSKNSDYETELTIGDYLETVADITDLIPWDSTSTITLQLQYYDGSNWISNYRAADWKTGTADSDFTVESKSGDQNIVRLQFPEKASMTDLTNYRLKIDIDQDPSDTTQGVTLNLRGPLQLEGEPEPNKQ